MNHTETTADAAYPRGCCLETLAVFWEELSLLRKTDFSFSFADITAAIQMATYRLAQRKANQEVN